MNVLGLFDVTWRGRAGRARTGGPADPLPLAPMARRSPGPVCPPPAAAELIDLADRLEAMAADRVPTDPGWIRERVRAVLALCEVAPITDQGSIDFLRHEVVGDRPAADDRLVDRIERTVRPGYLWRGAVLRPQQVVAWVRPRPDSELDAPSDVA